ncbi:hypothetical protein LTR12_016496 [Friedmanniomyces endolithicus]|nr:hypothetical protein LTR12_016496 [Friedmanniomyces endolithicus]
MEFGLIDTMARGDPIGVGMRLAKDSSLLVRRLQPRFYWCEPELPSTADAHFELRPRRQEFVAKLPSRDEGHDPLVHEDVHLVITDFAVCRLDQSINSRAKLMDDGLVDRASWAPKAYSVRERNASE